MKLASVVFVLSLVLSCHTARATSDSAAGAPLASATPSHTTIAHVGSDPGHAGEGTPLAPAPGDRLAAFAAGCFLGGGDAFPHVPGVGGTALGDAGGRTARPEYDGVWTARTGHAATV